MRIHRLEHSVSGLGPFQHGGQITDVIYRGIFATKDAMDDLDNVPVVRRLLKKHKGAVLFGFISEDRCLSIIRNKKVLDEHGFVISVYDREPLFVSDDGQVLFIR